MIENINRYIDHTLLKPAAQERDIEKLCQEARAFSFASVCINPGYVSLAKRLLSGSDVSVCTVIGFPLGATTTACKAAETREAYENGCDEFDMVISVGALKDGHADYVLNDIRAVVSEAKGKSTKVIIETGLLTEQEKILAAELACRAGASFVKTCTGMSAGEATEEDVRLIRNHITTGVRIKASAGIRTYEKAERLILAGADRIGTSAGAAIMRSAGK